MLLTCWLGSMYERGRRARPRRGTTSRGVRVRRAEELTCLVEFLEIRALLSTASLPVTPGVTQPEFSKRPETPLPGGAIAPRDVAAAVQTLTTTGRSDEFFYTQAEQVPEDFVVSPLTVESSPLINLTAFRGDPRFAGINGAGFSAVIIDTGIDLDDPFFGPDTDGNGVSDRIVFSYDFYGANDPDASDFNGHGSNVSSIVASSDATYTGMAPGANIIHLKVFPDGSGGAPTSDIEEALQWVVANAATYNIASVNLSLGGGNDAYLSDRSAWSDEFAALTALNVIPVAAAGNSFYPSSAQGIGGPASDVNTISVGAVYDSNAGSFSYGSGAIAYSTGPDRITPFSQRDVRLLDIMAPGAPITGAGANAGLTTFHGTSQASPHIAGIAVLADQLAVRTLGRRLTFDEYRTLLRQTAVNVFDGDDEDDNVTNTNEFYPRVDVLALGNAILAMKPASVTGTVFQDANGDGALNGSDAGIAGRTVYVDQNNNGTLDSGTLAFNSADVPKSLNDFTTVRSTTTVGGNLGPITDVNVQLNILHTFDGDLSGYLISPKGTRIRLFRDVGGGGDNFSTTTFDDEAGTPINLGSAPFNGSFRPDEALSTLDGEDPNGTWTLEVTDEANADIGTLNNWSLTISHAERSATSQTDGSYSLAGISAGSYTVRQIVPSGEIATAPASGSYSVTLAAGDSVSRSFGTMTATVPRILDEGDSGSSATGFTAFAGQGYQGDVQYAAAGSGASVAAWTFSGLTPGVYRVAATWPPYVNRATDAPYSIYDGPTLLSTVRVNQEQPPDSFTESGTGWEELESGILITSDTLQVRLSNAANEYVIADAVRIERVGDLPSGPEIELRQADGAGLVPLAGGVDFGATIVSTPVTKSFLVRNVGTSGPLSVGPLLSAPAGFEVSNLGAAADLQIGGTLVFTVTMNADNPASPSGPLSFSTSDADEGPFSFTVSGTVGTSLVRDDGDSGFGTVGGWQAWDQGGLGGDLKYSAAGSGENTATWSFSGAPGEYRLAATWVPNPNRATNAPYRISEGGTLLQTARVNQEQPPDELLNTDGANWEYLGGPFVITGGGFAVQLANDADEFVIADAVRLERVGERPIGPEVEVRLADGAGVIPVGGTAAFGTTFVGQPVTKTFLVRNVGTAPLTVNAAALPSGDFTLTGNLSDGQVLAAGATATFTVRLNATAVGNVSGTLSFGTSDGDENPYSFTVSGSVSGLGLLDDGDAGFSTTGGWAFFPGSGYQSDLRYAAAGNGSQTATWTFSSLPAGQYQVWTTWVPHPNRATDAPYTIKDGGARLGTVRVNQEQPPDDLTADGGAWESLGTFTISGGTLAVELSNAANEYVIADAVRIQYLGAPPSGPEAALLDGANEVPDGTGVVTWEPQFVRQAVSRTFTVRNVGTADLTVQPVSVDNPAFTVTSNLTAGQTLTPGQSATFTVSLSAAAAGTYTGTLSFGTNDADEDIYNVTLSGTVVTTKILDDGDAGFSTTGGWVNWTADGYQGDLRYAPAGSGSTMASWTFNNLPTGQYQVWTTWTPHPNRATNAPYTMKDGGSSLGTVLLNQELAPNDLTADAGVWESLGTFTITGDTLAVELSDAANEYVIADAVRIEWLGSGGGGSSFSTTAGTETSDSAQANSSSFDPSAPRLPPAQESLVIVASAEPVENQTSGLSQPLTYERSEAEMDDVFADRDLLEELLLAPALA